MNGKYTVAMLLAAAVLLTLAMPCVAGAAGPGVHGRVLGQDEQGKLLGVVAGAKIEFQNRGGAKVAQTTADKDGYYKVDLPPGEYLYKIEAAGYRKEAAGRGMKLTQSESYAIFNLALTKGQDDATRKPPEIPVQKIGKLRGRVLEKTPGGLVGIGEAGIALRREGTRELAIVRSRATADGDHQVGDFDVTLAAGSYRASVRAAGLETFIDQQPIEITAGGETTRDFVLSRPKPEESKGQGIRGVVTIIDSGVTPPPIQIQILPLGRGLAPIDLALGSNVAFSQDLPPGRYRVTANAEGFPTAHSPPVYVLEGRYSRVNLALRAEKVPEPQTTVEVFVYAKPAGTDETVALAGASVSLLQAGADPETAREGTTDQAGHAIFPVTAAGEYVAAAHLKGYRAGSGQGAVALGQRHEVGIELVKEISPPAEIVLSAAVSDAATKRPLAGAKVLARHQDQTLAEAARGVTDAKGEAALRVTRDGNYTVLVQLAGYEPGGVKTEVKSRPTNRVTIALQPIATASVEPEPTPPTEGETKRASVTGYVAYRELSGQLRSVPGATLVWERIALQQPAFNQFAETSNSGRYQIEVLPGQYQVRVEPPAGFERLSERVDVAAGTQEKYFIVRRSERPTPEPADKLVNVTGQVVTEAAPGRAVSVAHAEILFARATGVVKAESDAGGEFAARLAEDRYRVYVRAKGYRPLDAQADIRSGMSPLRLVLQRSAEPSLGALLNIVVVERPRGGLARALAPVADAEVQVSAEGRAVQAGATDKTGHYSTRVKPGSYTVGVGKRGFAKTSVQVAVASSDVTQQIVLTRSTGPGPEPEHKPTLTVHVTQRVDRPPMTIKPTGSPLAGAQVSVLRGSQRVAAGTTSASGSYSVQLPPGSYAVKASAQGYAPAGKTITLTDRDATADFQLDRTASTSAATSSGADQERNQPAASGATGSRSSGRDTRGKQSDRAAGRPVRTWYLVEHRDNAQSPWIELGTYTTQRDAQYALFRAVERGQIPGAAPAESRIRTVTRSAGGEDSRRPPRE
jgi:hypothetical protein